MAAPMMKNMRAKKFVNSKDKRRSSGPGTSAGTVIPGTRSDSTGPRNHAGSKKGLLGDSADSHMEALLTSLVGGKGGKERESPEEKALCILMKKIQTEGRHSVKHCDRDKLFPVCSFEKVMTILLQPDTDSIKLIRRFKAFMEFDDVRFYVMKYLLRYLKRPLKESDTLELVFVFLDNLSMTPDTGENGCSTNFFAISVASDENAATSVKLSSNKEQKQVFTWLWMEFLKQQLTRSLYKSVLMMLHDKVMPFLSNPLQLSDFLMQSYELGGVVSLLALNGLFVLVNSYNLNCPNFYEKLYALLTPDMFFVKFRARFMFLLDLFLTSTHLPAYLVAAFAKKLSRISLAAPPDALSSLIPLVYNLLIRHPNCKALLHASHNVNLSSDPFVDSEVDPAKCRALESSLWELKSLEEHYHYLISNEAKKCEQPLPRIEVSFEDELETSIDDLVEKETRKKLKRVATTFDAPDGLISSNDAIMNKMWVLG